MSLHPFNRRILAEELTRTRRADDRERYAASQRHARIDPNPHQIDAVIFALRRIREGGCILADEVGLGKTIEAGLVVAQLRAEGARRILLIVPKSLIGQWQDELLKLFGIQAQEETLDYFAPGVYVVGREVAGSEKGAAQLEAAPPFDLAVIDEAHEIFAGLHKRYRRDGTYDEESDEARMAHRVRRVLRATPVLLLTATPIQNSLAELWGLVQYVEPTGTLFGDISTFRKVFCSDDDRTLVSGQEHELQRRLAVVQQRTLRRQAQEFLDRPFMQRRCRLFEYTMSDAEKSLYDDVTEYLLEPTLLAFAGSQRRLLLIGFHRRMASSIPALAASLRNVAARLRKLSGGVAPEPLDSDAADLEETEAAAPVEQPRMVDPGAAAAELARVEGFIKRAESLPNDAKARSFQSAIRVILEMGRDGRGSGKAVVFTESIATQEYLRTLLLDIGLEDDEITLFRGDNSHRRALEALKRWREQEAPRLAPGTAPSREVAVRLALVHEFHTRSRVMVCTEAGAKGLNLQFCDTVINYDLPWNPQRIEQRIGRCHRYSQQRDVTVVNFIATGNDAQALTFEILSRKLDLFGKVLDASDTVLHEPRTDAPEMMVSALSVEVENDLVSIFSRSRTIEERTRELAALRDRVAERRLAYEREYHRTSQLIESRFDENVRKVFRTLRDELQVGLAQLDRDIADLVEGYLGARSGSQTRIDHADRVVFQIPPDSPVAVELGLGTTFSTGGARDLSDAERLNLPHSLVRAAIDDARSWPGGCVSLLLPDSPTPAMEALAGKSGIVRVVRMDYGGFEPVQRIVAGAVVDGAPVDPALAARILEMRAVDGPDLPPPDARWLDDAVEEAAFLDQREVDKAEQEFFERAVGRLERFVEDKVLVCRRERAAVADKLRDAHARRENVMGAIDRERVEREILGLASEREELDRRIEALDSREDEVYKKCRERYREMRSQPPTTIVLFQATFLIARPSPETSC